MRTHIHVYACMDAYKHACMHACCMFVCMYVRTYICTYVFMYLCIYVRRYVCYARLAYVRIYPYLHVCLCVHIYVDTRTHLCSIGCLHQAVQLLVACICEIMPTRASTMSTLSGSACELAFEVRDLALSMCGLLVEVWETAFEDSESVSRRSSRGLPIGTWRVTNRFVTPMLALWHLQ